MLQRGQVTAVPTYKEMLAWAAETDRRVAAGELPPLGSGQRGATRAADNLLSDQEKAQARVGPQFLIFLIVAVQHRRGLLTKRVVGCL